ncbi:Activating signal cointegrator 1 complex subunit 1 [Trachymyrmex cornetzi]|uniref:Activating signal cointegrator 1 complex subunit 1 n=2 Tax=Trachymyrmex cornetzi TaxID=471704 RepID=A0A151J989_9HYME|nr:Activating signal cointegrator 1 complex subunit 1 [Trachymyrmex cornetzi]
MDVLEPELIWVNGRCYRFYENTAWKNIHTSAPYMEDKESICSNEESETDIEIIPHDTLFKHTFYVPKIFYPHIIGTKGLTRKKLEHDTRTIIDIPKKGKDGNIVITARERKAIISARHRIDLLIEASKKKIRYTHFLSIPLNKKEIIDKYISFKNDILEKYNKTTHNIDESLFQNPSKLHLTIGMLKLFDDNEKKHAIDALTNCKENIIDPILEETGSINIQLQGVACMNDDPTDVKVLFAQIAPNEKLQELVDKVAEYFIKIGLMEKEYEKIKLHATLMNTAFKDDYSARFKERYDANEILQVYKDILFGKTILNQIDISERHTATKDNYYKSIGIAEMDVVRRLIILCMLTAVLPFLLIIIPLYLRHIFYADVAYAVTESDIIEINDGISTIFCSEHTLKMNGTFNAFQMTHRPEIASKRKHIRLKKSMNLPDDTLEYWGFYLLKSATVVLSVCSRFEGASILVVKGQKNLRTCGLLEHNINKQSQEIFFPGANKQVKIIYESNAQEIDSKETTTIELTKPTHNINDVDKSAVNTNSENERISETNLENDTRAYMKSLEHLETLYHTTTSYLDKYVGDQQESMNNNTRKGRHTKRHMLNINKNKRTKQRRKGVYNYNKKMRIQKLQETLNSDIINDRKEQEIKERDEMDTKRLKRSRELIKPPSLLDQGIKHGGNADKNYTSDSNEESSISSFETDLLNCYNGEILLAHEFQPSDQCTNISYLLNSKHIQANHHVEQDGYYYYIFYSDNDIVSNDIYAIFDIYKPTFQYENVTKSCINQTKCSFRINPLSADRVIVEIPTKDGIEHNEMDDAGILISICQPRMGAYMIFPIAILLLILGCAFI